ncbi:MAG TPA: urea transporter [Polyangiales bacterium]|nr:urea transporter [Polyangiales bacterium]
MAAVTQPAAASAAALWRAIERVLHVYAEAILSRRRIVGAGVLVALAAAPNSLLFSACALLGAALAQRGLRLVRDFTPYSLNALLCGSALASLYGLTPESAILALALGAFAVVVTAALASLVSSFGYIPVAALPYTLSMWAVLGLAPYLDLGAATPSADRWAELLPHWAALWLQSLGSVLLVPKVFAGAALLCALLAHSRIASVVAALTLSAILGMLQLAPLQPADALTHSACANGVVAALALGGVWLVPSGATTFVAVSGGVLAALFTLGSAVPLYLVGLWPGFLPACIALVLVLTALRQRGDQRSPELAQSVAANPEQLLLDHLARPRLAPSGLRLTPPFHGAWMCTQGANGPFTHRGTLAHAYDFEICAEEGSLCSGHGEQPQDYHCFAQPVLAVADGTVVAIENSQPNNAIGDVDSQRPWGNYVIVQHAPEVFSLVAHLSPGTITVYPGQYVQRGGVVGYCGSSGRSPRPHLHFQLQSGPALGAATVPCGLQDMVVRKGDALRFEPLHEPAQGETLRSLVPDYALASLIDAPLGATLTYRIGDKTERVVCELDSWGRTQLRSLDLDAQLVFTRTQSCMRSSELRGSSRSVLRLWRLALGMVAFERSPSLSFANSIPRRWLAGFGRELLWDFAAALRTPAAIEIESRMRIDAEGLSVVSQSKQRATNGEPMLRCCVRFAVLPGPSVIEVTTQLGAARTWRAELVVEAPEPRAVLSQDTRLAPPGFGLELGDWS